MSHFINLFVIWRFIMPHRHVHSYYEAFCESLIEQNSYFEYILKNILAVLVLVSDLSIIVIRIMIIIRKHKLDYIHEQVVQ